MYSLIIFTKKISLIAATLGTLAMLSSTGAMAAANPSGRGQPSASCGSANALVEPNGFSTSGFSKAETVYAGSPGTPSAMHAQSPHAVSQYDVACYQLSQ